MLTFTWPVTGRPQLDPGKPKTMPRDSKAGAGFSGHLAFPPKPIIFLFLWVSSCGPGKCPLWVCGLKPRRGSCLYSVY